MKNKKKQQKFKPLEHTADIGISVRGKTLEELFENASYGMFSILVENLNEVLPLKKLNVSIQGIDKESLLINYLNELLYIYSTKKIVFSKFKIKINKNKLKSIIFGEKFNSKKHIIYNEIKAATYHNLKIKQYNNMFSTQIIFDV